MFKLVLYTSILYYTIQVLYYIIQVLYTIEYYNYIVQYLYNIVLAYIYIYIYIYTCIYTYYIYTYIYTYYIIIYLCIFIYIYIYIVHGFSLTKGQCLKRQNILSVLAVHRPFYISILSPLCLRSTLRLIQYTCMYIYSSTCIYYFVYSTCIYTVSAYIA